MQNFTPHKLRKEAICIDNKDKTDEIESYFFEGNKCVIVYKSSDKAYSYPKSRIKMVRSAIQSERLGKESAIGKFSTLLLYFNTKLGEDGMQEAIKDASIRNEIKFSTSANFKLKSE
ncbi:hypothetical protein OF897_18385 [Chryseobacterium formosus]|uniref:KTSC domain-containing protein n=1 Tax=Chryseobacterium formosus TaxID=1537363 RepID=A0ABT3XW21_9FLAO|nr:hypothetical protein [Chryseobacterium formosus]MCX8525886.1 hypothetical protein [Chryseobacterium formosus]